MPHQTKLILITHSEDDRVRRVTALIHENKATPGLFVEVFPEADEVAHPDDRWFMQVTSPTITGTVLTGDVHI